MSWLHLTLNTRNSKLWICMKLTESSWWIWGIDPVPIKSMPVHGITVSENFYFFTRESCSVNLSKTRQFAVESYLRFRWSSYWHFWRWFVDVDLFRGWGCISDSRGPGGGNRMESKSIRLKGGRWEGYIERFSTVEVKDSTSAREHRYGSGMIRSVSRTTNLVLRAGHW